MCNIGCLRSDLVDAPPANDVADRASRSSAGMDTGTSTGANAMTQHGDPEPDTEKEPEP
eukprot:SAG11_NODE_8016_length_1069_cov_1.548454_2_plen_59_part_00